MRKDTPQLSDFLCFAIYSANLAYGKAYKPILEKLGVTYTQYIAIVALWEQDHQTVGSLGEKLFLESNTLTLLLKRLEGLGHVTRLRDPGDERQVRIHLTESGRALAAKMRDIPRCVGEATGLDWPTARELLTALHDLRAALKDGAEA